MLPLLQFHNPKAVIVTGVGVAEWAAPLYKLEWKENDLPEGSHRLVRHYTDGVRPWAFIKHPAGFGFSNKQKEKIKTYLRNQIL